MTRNEAARELLKRGFQYSHIVYSGEYPREYWLRTDGKPQVFLDHSATITVIDGEALISDFVEKRS